MTGIGEAWTGRLEKTGRSEQDGSGELIRKGVVMKKGERVNATTS